MERKEFEKTVKLVRDMFDIVGEDAIYQFSYTGIHVSWSGFLKIVNHYGGIPKTENMADWVSASFTTQNRNIWSRLPDRYTPKADDIDWGEPIGELIKRTVEGVDAVKEGEQNI